MHGFEFFQQCVVGVIAMTGIKKGSVPFILLSLYLGLAAVAAEAGISRETLYRTLSPKGNPTLKTLIAVLKTVGLRLSVEQEQHAHH